MTQRAQHLTNRTTKQASGPSLSLQAEVHCGRGGDSQRGSGMERDDRDARVKIGEAKADPALDRLGEETAKAPAVFWHALRNLLLTAERRGRIDDRHADASMVGLRRHPVVCPRETDNREVMALARTHRPTAYGSSYLSFAIREGCALANLDRCLNEATAAEGVATFA